jgi:parallel beta-helix repeat protein
MLHTNRRRNKQIITMIFVIALGYLPLISNAGLNFNASITSTMPRGAAAHEPVALVGNAEISAYFSGNTSQNGLGWSTAFLIDHWDITADLYGNGICLNDTDFYIIISNCTIQNAGGSNIDDAGINLNNATHILIQNNSIGNWDGNGVYLNSSLDIGIINNTIVSNEINIKVENTQQINISKNIIQTANFYGISLDNTSSLEISNNGINANTFTGITGQSANNTDIKNNNVTYNTGEGIGLYVSNQVKISENIITHNTGTGLEIMYNSTYYQLSSNNISTNKMGINIDGLNHSVINLCDITQNNDTILGGGIASNNSYNLTVSNSVVAYNNNTGISFENTNGSKIIGTQVYENAPGWDGIVLKNSSNVLINQSYIHHVSRGIVLLNRAELINITWNQIYYNGADGIQTKTGSDNNLIQNNTIFANSNDGIEVTGTNYLVESNSIFSNQKNGINITNGLAVEVNLNQIYLNTLDGIFHAFTMGNIIANNISQNANNGITSSFSTFNIIQNNTINNNIVNGIVLQNNADNNRIMNNTIIANSNTGIVVGCTGNNITGNKIMHHNKGINLSSLSDTTRIEYNNLSKNTQGIFIDKSNQNIINANQLDECGIVIDADLTSDIDQNVIGVSNKINNKTIYWYVGQTGLAAANFNNPGQIILSDCDNSAIANEIISNTNIGILLLFCEYIQITNVSVENCLEYGIIVYKTDNTTISDCKIRDNTGYGLVLVNSNSSKIFLNQISNNGGGTGVLHLTCVYNTWDNTTHGNYWGDYVSRYPSASNDGIFWSMPYEVGGTSTGVWDNHPMTFTPNMNVAPVVSAWTGPTLIYERSSTGNVITWTVVDGTIYNGTYYVLLNGSEIANGTWTSGVAITLNIDNKLIGFYGYTIYITDGVEIISRSTVLTVYNNGPTLSNPADFLVSLGTTGNLVSWTVSDISFASSSYVIYKDGVSVNTGTWYHNKIISYNLDSLIKKVYNFTLVVFDGYGGSATNQVYVTVLENNAPTITSPVDITLTLGQLGRFLNWTITDITTNAPTFLINLNGVNVTLATSWATGVSVNFTLNALPVGVNNITITAFDGLGKSVSDAVVVTVIAAVTNSSTTTTSTATASDDEGGIDGYAMPSFIFLTFGTLIAMIIIKKRKIQ